MWLLLRLDVNKTQQDMYVQEIIRPIYVRGEPAVSYR